MRSEQEQANAETEVEVEGLVDEIIPVRSFCKQILECNETDTRWSDVYGFVREEREALYLMEGVLALCRAFNALAHRYADAIAEALEAHPFYPGAPPMVPALPELNPWLMDKLCLFGGVENWLALIVDVLRRRKAIKTESPHELMPEFPALFLQLLYEVRFATPSDRVIKSLEAGIYPCHLQFDRGDCGSLARRCRFLRKALDETLGKLGRMEEELQAEAAEDQS